MPSFKKSDQQNQPPRKQGALRRRRMLGRSILLSTSLVLATSAGIRLGGVGFAIAKDVEESVTQNGTGEAAQTQDPDISQILNDLQKRQEGLAERERLLEDRLQALSLAEEQISKQTAALVEAESRLASTIATAKTAASDDLTRLTSLYENMKPKQAVPLFEEMAPDFAAGFLARMKPAAAAQIMAGLQPQTAYAISVVLAGRNSRAPTE